MSIKLGIFIAPISLRVRWALKVVATIAVVLLFAVRFDAGAGFFWGFLAACLVGLCDARLAVVAGLFALGSCPLLLLAEQYAWLQQSTLVSYYASSIGIVTFSGASDVVAVWAYYLLCIGVLSLSARALFVRNAVTPERVADKTAEMTKGLEQDAQQTQVVRAI